MRRRTRPLCEERWCFSRRRLCRSRLASSSHTAEAEEEAEAGGAWDGFVHDGDDAGDDPTDDPTDEAGSQGPSEPGSADNSNVSGDEATSGDDEMGDRANAACPW